MTDNEIIKALECCNQEDMCDQCPYQMKERFYLLKVTQLSIVMGVIFK